MEVETPVLSHHGNTDPNIRSFTTRYAAPDRPAAVELYLNTSPEFAMKRLLAAGYGPLYQVARVFRDGEQGSRHQPEFSMLEWYRPGFDHHRLMDEIDDLLTLVGLEPACRYPYASVFEECTGLDPHRVDEAQLLQVAAADGLAIDVPDRGTLLDFLFSHRVVPSLDTDKPVFIYDFPVCQAALARIRRGAPDVAERFELLIGGLELANGFHELTDAAEQQARFSEENRHRDTRQLPMIDIDTNLLAALEQGLPDCAGVALGLDRLLMVLTGASRIDEVLAFPHERS